MDNPFEGIFHFLNLNRGPVKTKKLFNLDPVNIASYESFTVRERQLAQRAKDLRIDLQALQSDRALWWRQIEQKNNLAGRDLRYINGEVHEIVPDDQDGGDGNV